MVKVKLTNGKEFNAYLKAEAKRVHMLIIRALSMLGEETVREARDRGYDKSWVDQTGNLRSSIGYVVIHNGRIVTMSSFEVVKSGGEGASTGREFAEELASRYTSGYVLLVVAGMNYAEYVEAMDHKDVLASPELYARKRLPKILSALEKQIMR